jgi:hypothetical protein
MFIAVIVYSFAVRYPAIVVNESLCLSSYQLRFIKIYEYYGILLIISN